MTVSDLASRPTRTLVQAGVAGVVVEFADAFVYDMNERQYAALLALLMVLFAGLQVLIENKFGKTLLRNYDSVKGTVVDGKPGGAL